MLIAGATACSQLLGDFTTGSGGDGGDDGGPDVTIDHGSSGGDSSGGDVVGNDSPNGDGGGEAEAGPPPVPGKPGYDTVTGGSWSKSTNFSLVGAIGESPGGNTVGKSANYTLNGGVIAVTQQ